MKTTFPLPNNYVITRNEALPDGGRVVETLYRPGSGQAAPLVLEGELMCTAASVIFHPRPAPTPVEAVLRSYESAPTGHRFVFARVS